MFTESEQILETRHFRAWRAWRRDHGGEVFPTDSSLEWFMRLNRKRLVASGQLIIVRGKKGSMVGPRFAEVCMQIMRDQSAALAAQQNDSVAL